MAVPSRAKVRRLRTDPACVFSPRRRSGAVCPLPSRCARPEGRICCDRCGPWPPLRELDAEDGGGRRMALKAAGSNRAGLDPLVDPMRLPPCRADAEANRLQEFAGLDEAVDRPLGQPCPFHHLGEAEQSPVCSSFTRPMRLSVSSILEPSRAVSAPTRPSLRRCEEVMAISLACVRASPNSDTRFTYRIRNHRDLPLAQRACRP